MTKIHVPAYLVEAGHCGTSNQARKNIDAGAVQLDGRVLDFGEYDVEVADGEYHSIWLGRRVRPIRFKVGE